ncbi:cellulose binding domain-containing protein [Streptomyces flavochromogenes]|uniref:cellulose binding domain-containing protein n=1 Tax=Streptomyces flavochromogenes TaxID=68199 RepID=UPI00099B4768
MSRPVADRFLHQLPPDEREPPHEHAPRAVPRARRATTPSPTPTDPATPPTPGPTDPTAPPTTEPTGPTTPPTTHAAAGCAVTYTLADWGTTFNGGVTIRNTGGTPVAGWQLAFDFPGDQRITQMWNAVPEQDRRNVTATNPSGYNVTIVPGTTVNFGFNGTSSAGTTGCRPPSPSTGSPAPPPDRTPHSTWGVRFSGHPTSAFSPGSPWPAVVEDAHARVLSGLLPQIRVNGEEVRANLVRVSQIFDGSPSVLESDGPRAACSYESTPPSSPQGAPAVLRPRDRAALVHGEPQPWPTRRYRTRATARGATGTDEGSPQKT